MSDMIDRLSVIANETGSESAARLAAGDVTATLASQVRRDVRRRRMLASALAAVLLVIATTAALVVPTLLAPEPVAPTRAGRVPVETNEGLITYSDGSMQALTRVGNLVEVPPAAAGAPALAVTSEEQACAADPSALTPGWTPAFADALALVTFAHPLLVDETGSHALTQGQDVELATDYADATFAFSLDVDAAIARHVVVAMTSYVLAPDGTVAQFASHLESQPAIVFLGDDDRARTASVTTRSFRGGQACPGASSSATGGAGDGIVRYLTVTAFLDDGHGHVNPIATHTSWVTLNSEAA